MGDDNTSIDELKVTHIEEFVRIQNFLLACDNEDAKVYQLLFDRYNELKVILSTLGVNTTTIDKIEK